MSMEDLMDINFLEMILRTTVAFGALLVLARILGKKQMSQLTFFHYITGIAFGSIAAEMAGQRDMPFMEGLVALVWWALLTWMLSYISLKSGKLRVVIEDEPSIIIRNGVLLDKELKKSRIHMDAIMMMLREQSVFSIQDVYYAVLETNGELSVMKKAELQEPTKADVKAPITEPLYIPSEIISDGKLVVKNMQELKLTEEWVMKKLKKKEIYSIEEVFYAQIQMDGSLFVDVKSKQG